MKKILNFLKLHYKKIIVIVSCFMLLLVFSFSFINNKTVSASSSNGGNASFTYSKDYFNDTYFSSQTSTSDYLSMFSNSSHIFKLWGDDTIESRENINLSFGNYFTLADNDKLILSSTNASNTNQVVYAKESGATFNNYVIYNRVDENVGCTEYTISYDNFIMPVPYVRYDEYGEVLDDYSRNYGFGLFINAFRNYFANDTVIFSDTINNPNSHYLYDVVSHVYLPQSRLDSNGEGAAPTPYTETSDYRFYLNNITGGSIGSLYSGLYRNNYGDDYSTLNDVYIPFVSTHQVTTSDFLINNYHGFIFIPRLELTFYSRSGRTEYGGITCFHRTPMAYGGDVFTAPINYFNDNIFNMYVRSCFEGTGDLMQEYYSYGYNNGYYYGYDYGYEVGYDDGYDYGFGLANKYNTPFDIIWATVESFFNFEIFPNFKVYYMILFGLGISIFGLILKYAFGG